MIQNLGGKTLFFITNAIFLLVRSADNVLVTAELHSTEKLLFSILYSGDSVFIVGYWMLLSLKDHNGVWIVKRKPLAEFILVCDISISALRSATASLEYSR